MLRKPALSEVWELVAFLSLRDSLHHGVTGPQSMRALRRGRYPHDRAIQELFGRSIRRCVINVQRLRFAMPDRQLARAGGQLSFLALAYHALYYTDLYLSHDENSYQAPGFCREDYQFFGRKPWPPHEAVVADVPYEKDVILQYVEHCRRKATDSIAMETTESLVGPSGFWWYPIPRAEFHLNNIRHVQHHGAQLSLYLRKSADLDVGWVGTGHAR